MIARDNRYRFTLSAIVAALVMFLMANFAWAHGDITKHKKQVVIFIVNNISSDLLASVDVPNIRRLQEAGSYGLMNVRSAGTFTDGSGHLTIGAGTKSAAGAAGDQAYLPNEQLAGKFSTRSAAEIFNELTGETATGDQLVHIGLESVKRRSASVPFNIVPGLLGQSLKDQELTVALIGNADSTSTLHRESALIGIDMKGMIDKAYFPARVSSEKTLVTDPFLSNKVRSQDDVLDPEILINYYDKVASKNLLIVDTGATARINARYAITAPSKFSRDRESALIEADRAIGLFMEKIIARDPGLKDHLIMVLSPDPARDKIAQKNYLTPIIVTGQEFSGGTLETDTTRRHGVITNMDVAPTILSFFGVEPPVAMAGRPFRPAMEPEPVSLTESIQSKAVIMYQSRNSILSMITFANIAVLVFLLVYILIYRQEKTPFIRRYPYIIYFLLLIPLAFLFQWPVTVSNYPQPVILSFALTAALTGALVFISRSSVLKALVVACLTTSAAIVADIWAGGGLMLNSYFGSDLIAGGRFYGIGNTYMGILVGAVLVGVSGFWQLSKLSESAKLLAGSAVLLLVAVSIGHPRLGANVGGFITGVSALVFFVLLFKFEKIRLRHLMGLGGIIFVSLGALIMVDLFLNPVQSHLARAVISIQSGGIMEVFEIIHRKINLNLRFFSSSFLSSILVLAIVLLIPLFSRPRGLLLEIRDSNKPLFQGLTAAAFTSLVALIFNDTGVVAAAAASQFIIFPVLLLVAERINNAEVFTTSIAHDGSKASAIDSEQGG